MSDSDKRPELLNTEIAAILDRGNAQYIALIQMSASYGQIAIRSALILNGGALFAGLAFMGAIANSQGFSEVKTGFYAAGAFFIGGIISAAISSLIAYLNFGLSANKVLFDMALATMNKTIEYQPDHYKENKEEFDSSKKYNLKEVGEFERKMNLTAIISIGLGIVAYTFFTAGCMIVGGTMATA